MGWGLSADPRDVAWARSPGDSFCGGKGRLGSWASLGKGTESFQAPHLFWDPSGPSRVGPQQSSLFPLRAPSGEVAGARGKQAGAFSVSL